LEKIKVLLVDDQTLFLESLYMVLEFLAEDLVVVGAASNGKIALQLAEEKNPDVVLMDVRMPEMDGVESTRAIKEKFPEMKVLILTTFDDDEYAIQALHLGAIGYLLKDMQPQKIILAIRTVYQGEVLIAPQVASKLVERLFRIGYGNTARSNPTWLKKLNDQEKEILRLLAQGCNNREIAARLYLAEQTVKNYVSVIYGKIGVRDRVKASQLAAALLN
jgi:DNA-binding NarL/FixJ family response regulator